MKICNNCNSEVDDNSVFCPNCGNKLLKKKCLSCGKELDENEKFCKSCGFSLEKANENKDDSEDLESLLIKGINSYKVASIILAIIIAIYYFTTDKNSTIYSIITFILFFAYIGLFLILKFSSPTYKMWKRCKKWGTIFIVIFGINAFINITSSPKITYDPVKDSKTYIEILKHDEKEAEDYALIVIAAYRQQGKKEDADRFIRLTADELNNYLMDMMN